MIDNYALGERISSLAVLKTSLKRTMKLSLRVLFRTCKNNLQSMQESCLRILTESNGVGEKKRKKNLFMVTPQPIVIA